MPKRLMSYVPAAAAGLFTMVILLSPNKVLASGDCLALPSRESVPGGQWYYRADRVNNRKCWYFVSPGPTMPQAEAPQAYPSPNATLQPTHSFFFSSPTADFTAANPAGSQQVPTNNNTRPTQAAGPDDPKNDDAVRVKQPRMAPHPDSNAAPLKQRRQSPTRPRVEHANERHAAPLTEAERDALYKKFLQWERGETSHAP